MSRIATAENFEQTIPNSPALLHGLETGFPFKPAANFPEDFVMKEN
jgi:hypothetical protein